MGQLLLPGGGAAAAGITAVTITPISYCLYVSGTSLRLKEYENLFFHSEIVSRWHGMCVCVCLFYQSSSGLNI